MNEKGLKNSLPLRPQLLTSVAGLAVLSVSLGAQFEQLALVVSSTFSS